MRCSAIVIRYSLSVNFSGNLCFMDVIISLQRVFVVCYNTMGVMFSFYRALF